MARSDEEALLAGHEHYRQKPKLYKWRWVVLATFCALQAYCSIVQMAFIGIKEQTEQWYPVSSYLIQLTALAYSIVPIFLTWAAIPMLSKLGLSVSLFAGAGFNLVSSWIRFFARHSGVTNFYIMLVGQTFGAAAQVFVLNAMTLVAANWFGDDERTLATSLGALWGILGQGLSFAMQAIIINGDASKIPLMVTIQAVMGTVTSLATFAFVRSAPPSPPSAAGAEERNTSLSFAMKRMLSDVQFILLMVSFAFSYGTLIAFMTLISDIILASDPSYDPNFPSILGAVAIGTGTIGAVVSAIAIDKTKKYMLVVWTCGLGTVITFVGATAILFFKHMEIELYLAMGFGGFFGVALVPLLYEVAVELTFPAPESASTALLNLVGQIVGSGLGLALLAFKNHGGMVKAMYVIDAAFVFSIVLLLCYRGEFRRQAFEAEKLAARDQETVQVVDYQKMENQY